MDIYSSKPVARVATLHSDTSAKIAGPGSAAIKYDVITALLVLSGQDTGPQGRLAARLALVITARFNWRRGSFSVGLRELGRMWGVTERTAKREMAQMRSLGWISVEVPAARGRVAQHKIIFATVLKDTMPYWDAVGPDFAARLSGAGEVDPSAATNVVPLRTKPETNTPQSGVIWPQVAERLRAQDGAIFDAWFSKLEEIEVDGTRLILAAPSGFVADYVKTHFQTRLLAATCTQDPTLRDVQVIWTG